MTEASPALSRDPLTRRALERDSLAEILPMHRRDRLAGILADEDAATLKYLAKQGMGEGLGKPTPCGENSLRETREPPAEATEPVGASDGKDGDSRGARKPLRSSAPPK